MTGMSYPGRDWLAANIPYCTDDRELRHYSPQVIGNMLTRRAKSGYIEQDQRGRDGRGRAVAHYVTQTPEDAYNLSSYTRKLA
jgi:hypothetical protein